MRTVGSRKRVGMSCDDSEKDVEGTGFADVDWIAFAARSSSHVQDDDSTRWKGNVARVGDRIGNHIHLNYR